jgi:nicotinamidase-related amidase
VDALVEPHFDSAALITIDTQVDTLDGQPLEIPGTSSILPNLHRLCEEFRQAERFIVHMIRLYRADGSNSEPVRRDLIRRSARPVLRPGAPGRLLAPGLGPTPPVDLNDDLLLAGGVQPVGPFEVVIYKPRWGAFYQTPLQEHLNRHQVQTIVFGGCNFPNCPRTSIYEASERDYRIVVADDAVSGLYDQGRAELTNIGVSLMLTRQVVEAMRAVGPSTFPSAARPVT